MALEVGNLIRYKFNELCIGAVLEVGETMAKIRWHDEDIVEWMPYYALELLDV